MTSLTLPVPCQWLRYQLIIGQLKLRVMAGQGRSSPSAQTCCGWHSYFLNFSNTPVVLKADT
ncbi:hypothetical protein GALMADRAFT_1257081 [Galerina marginata CBS 339.88]|uniref:Uncharacterized protein n=1 Tax=Galerina marginata (strain CBS 339.88) TaxID=685588 RepID=A0A067T5X0_GALM3|nr:hypothetical protein GALMADRAFT_1257081 [Galerina marginata CBS 339.88]